MASAKTWRLPDRRIIHSIGGSGLGAIATDLDRLLDFAASRANLQLQPPGAYQFGAKNEGHRDGGGHCRHRQRLVFVQMRA
jgi:hypothetical protein